MLQHQRFVRVALSLPVAIAVPWRSSSTLRDNLRTKWHAASETTKAISPRKYSNVWQTTTSPHPGPEAWSGVR